MSVLRGSCAGGLLDPTFPHGGPGFPALRLKTPLAAGPSALTSKMLPLWSPFPHFPLLLVDNFLKNNLSSSIGGDGVKAGVCLPTVTFTRK